MSMLCAVCSGPVARSHSRGIHEKLIKTFSPYKVYRCRSCGWRGWLAKDYQTNKRTTRHRVIQIAACLLVIIFVTVLVLYLSME